MPACNRARLTGADFINCGRAPTTESILFIEVAGYKPTLIITNVGGAPKAIDHVTVRRSKLGVYSLLSRTAGRYDALLYRALCHAEGVLDGFGVGAAMRLDEYAVEAHDE